MATIRAAIDEASRALRATGTGEDPAADELAAGLAAAQALILELHEARGPLRDLDVATDYVAGENQRVRVIAGATVTVTLPNAVAIGATAATGGSTGAADGASWRAPMDGARA